MKKIKTGIMTLFGKGRKFALKQYTLFLQNVEIAVGHGPKGPKCPTHISLLKLFLPDKRQICDSLYVKQNCAGWSPSRLYGYGLKLEMNHRRSFQNQ